MELNIYERLKGVISLSGTDSSQDDESPGGFTLTRRIRLGDIGGEVSVYVRLPDDVSASTLQHLIKSCGGTRWLERHKANPFSKTHYNDSSFLRGSAHPGFLYCMMNDSSPLQGGEVSCMQSA